jgi:DNA mismatch repair protein MutS2
MAEEGGDAGSAPPPAGARDDRRRTAGREHALRVLEYRRVLELVARRATSDQGRERIRSLRPSSAPVAVRDALDAAEETATFLAETESWAPPPIPEVEGVLRRLRVEGSVLDEDGLIGVARLLASSRSARRDLPTGEDTLPRLSALAGRLAREAELQERLERSFDEGGEVADAASKRLRKIRSDLRSQRSGLVDLLERLSRDLRDRIRVPEASVTVRAGRYCIPIRREGRSEVGGIVHDESSSGQTLFVEPPQAIEPMNRVRELEAEESREVQRILRELTEEVRPLEPKLSRSLEALVELDVLFARARYAGDHGGSRPRIGSREERGEVRIEEGYHPLLLAGDEEAVPFDLRLDPDERVLLVSGPNAGGKTVLLKAIGLLSALAQTGVVPPVGPGTRLPFFGEIFAVIGDEQSIDASLSTFSAQMGTLKEILEEADAASLVLLDELGSHTDPAEGAALAASALLRLAGQAGLTVATSHLGALKALAGEDRRVVNASLQFDRDRLRPTYRLRRDRPGRSYAFEIAERLGLPGDVVAGARERLEDAERRMEEVLAELEEKEEELERLTGDAEEREARAERLEAQLEEKEAELERREAEVEAAAREKAEAYLLEAREEVEQAIGRLEERAGADGELDEAASDARSRVEAAVRASRESLPEVPEGPAAEPPDVEPGDPVRIRSLDRRGEVLELRGDRIVVEAGGVRLTLPATDLEAVAEGEDAGEPSDGHAASRSGGGRRPRMEAQSEVDLRGLRVDEVERRLVPSLDAAVVADLPRFRIVHGKGTGALREKVREILAADPRVETYRSGERGEGGTGVTVVEFDAT